MPDYSGSPPGCHPECVISTECPPDKACLNKKCSNPCVDVCGINTECRVINHSPVCSCKALYTGDPFTRCNPLPRKCSLNYLTCLRIHAYCYYDNIFNFLAPIANVEVEPYKNPCIPSPCGPHAICQEIGKIPSCTCMPNFVGSPPNCRPECVVNSECLSSQACMQQKCQDPCEGSCGIGALCSVSRHVPICTCPEGYTGDAFSVCLPKPQPGTSAIMNTFTNGFAFV